MMKQRRSRSKWIHPHAQGKGFWACGVLFLVLAYLFDLIDMSLVLLLETIACADGGEVTTFSLLLPAGQTSYDPCGGKIANTNCL